MRDGREAVYAKELSFAGDALTVTYRFFPHPGPSPLRAVLAVEWNVGLLAGDADDRYVLADGVKPEDPRACGEGEFTATMVEAVDGWQRLKARFTMTRPTRVWRMPVWTVSQSEGGFERTYQSTAFYFCFPLALAPGESKTFSFTHDVIDLES
jgi:alpha-amylase